MTMPRDLSLREFARRNPQLSPLQAQNAFAERRIADPSEQQPPMSNREFGGFGVAEGRDRTIFDPLIDPRPVEAWGRSAPGIIGDVAGPTLGAAAHLTSPFDIFLTLASAGILPGASGALRSIPYAGRVLGPVTERLAPTFTKALGAETAAGVGGVLGAQEVIEHTENLPGPARIPLTIGGGLLGAAATLATPSLARGTYRGGKILTDIQKMENAIDDVIQARRSAEDPSFNGTVDPGGSYGKTVETEGRIVPDVEPEAPKAPSALPATEKIYHGTRATDTSTFINKNGDLVLKQSENYDGRQKGVSFTDDLESAREYATRSTTYDDKSLAAIRQYDGTVFEIDKDAAGDLLPEAMNELFADGRDVVIPKGKFKALDTKGLAPTRDDLIKEMESSYPIGEGLHKKFSERFLNEKADELDAIPNKTQQEEDLAEEISSTLGQYEETGLDGFDEADFAEYPLRYDDTYKYTSLAREAPARAAAAKETAVPPEQILAENTEKFLDESLNRKKVLRDENIADIKDPIDRAINRQVEEARVREVLNSGVVDGPVSNIVGPAGHEARRLRATFDSSDDPRIRSLAPIFGKFFRTINASDARRLRDALDKYPLSHRQEEVVQRILKATGFDQSVRVARVDSAASADSFSDAELISFVRHEGRELTIREAAELTQKGTHNFQVFADDGSPMANVTMTKSKGATSTGKPLFEMSGRGYQLNPDKLGKIGRNEYEILIEALSPAGEVLSLSAKDRVNKQSRRQIMEVADEIFRQTDADVLRGERVTGSKKGRGASQSINRKQVDRYFNRSVITGDEAERVQDAINNWNRPSSTDDAIIAQMENDKLARRIIDGESLEDLMGGDPPPGTFTGWDPSDPTPRARASENAMSDATEINTWEPIGQDAQRLFAAARTYESAAISAGVRAGEKFAKARGIKTWNEENALPLFRALHDPDKHLNTLSPEMQEIYYDLKRNWVYKEENDMFTFLSYGAAKNAAQFKIDMEQMASRFMAHPHYFNRIWRYFDQPEGETLHKMWKTSGSSKDPRPGFDTTMEHSRNARTFDEMVDKFKFRPAMWDPYKMAAHRRMAGVEYRESIRFLLRLGERGLMDNTSAKGGDPRWAVPSGIPLMNGRKGSVELGTPDMPVIHVPTNMANWMEQVWTSPDTLFSDPVLFNKSIREWSTTSKLLKLVASGFQHADMLTRTSGALFTPTALYSPLKRGGSDRFGLHGLKLPDMVGGQSLDRLSIPTGRLPGPLKLPSAMVDLFKVQFFNSAREGNSDFMISPTRINKDYPLTWENLVQRDGLNVHGDYSVLAEEMRADVIKVLQPRMEKQADGTMKKVWLYPGAPIGAAKTMIRAAEKLQDFFVKGLFDGVYSVLMKYAIENFILPAMRRNHPKWTEAQVGAAVAENANMIFSALNNWQTFLKDRAPEFQQLVQLAAFSSGETESLMRQAFRGVIPRVKHREAREMQNPMRSTRAEHQGGIPLPGIKSLHKPRSSKRKLVMSPHMGIHAEHILGMFVTLTFAANVINKYATGEGDNPAERFKNGSWLGMDKHYPVTNQDPYATFDQIGYNNGFLSPKVPAEWGQGRGGTDLYLDLVGQQDTAFKWLLSPEQSLTSRFHTLPRAVLNQIKGTTFSGVPFGTPLQRVSQFVQDIAFPISGLQTIAATRKFAPGAFNMSSYTLPGEDRLSSGALLAQAVGQNVKAMNTKLLVEKYESLPEGSPERKRLEAEHEIRKVEAAIKGQYNWGFVRSSTIEAAYEFFREDDATLRQLDEAFDYLVMSEKLGGAGRSNLKRPKWRQVQLEGNKNKGKTPVGASSGNADPFEHLRR